MYSKQCSNCIKNRGNLTCDPYPEHIPDNILSGKTHCIYFRRVPESMQKSVQAHAKTLLVNERERYEKVKGEYKQKRGAKEEDFQPGGKYYGMSTNQLIDLARG
jgi:hypothetical protein